MTRHLVPGGNHQISCFSEKAPFYGQGSLRKVHSADELGTLLSKNPGRHFDFAASFGHHIQKRPKEIGSLLLRES